MEQAAELKCRNDDGSNWANIFKQAASFVSDHEQLLPSVNASSKAHVICRRLFKMCMKYNVQYA